MNKAMLDNLHSFFVRMRPRLQALAQARTGCRVTAEDLVQNVWLKIERIETPGAIRNPDGFLTQIVNNAVLDHLRKERRRAEINAEVNELLGERLDNVSPERMLIGREKIDVLQQALDELPEKTRRIFLMNRIDHIPHRQIAKIVGISDEAVYYHIRRALDRLALLRDQFDD
ncbi:RNA polymerase sigma factor [Brenneria sp. g21c3]|uniref:RNA polymerase sigma factor n=1 Tax=Brenneria sp. g21c3 TaxID=3093893 RepID=UPI002EBFB3DB|nr:RNA polymerase sigma factor [Brenneria sp. g21c3]